MAKTITDHIALWAWRDGYSPRLIIEFPYIEQHFSYGSEITLKNFENQSDGAVSLGGNTLTSSLATFSTNNIYAGDKVVIESGDNAGTYIIDSVDSETQVTITTTFPAAQTGMTYFIARTYEDLISSPPSFSYNSKREGGFAIVNNIAFGILNHDYFSNFLNTSSFPKPEGKTIYCYLIFDDGSTYLESSDRFQIFQGVIDGSPSINQNEVGFEAKSKDVFVSDIIGEKIQLSDVSDLVSEIYDKSLDKIKPMSYGNFIKYNFVGKLSVTDFASNKIPKSTQLLYLGMDSTYGCQLWYCSQNQIGDKQIGSLDSMGLVYMDVGDYDAVVYAGDANYFNIIRNDNIQGSILRIGDITGGLSPWITYGIVNLSPDQSVDPNTSTTITSTGTINNPENAADWDKTTYCEMILPCQGVGQYISLFIRFPFTTLNFEYDSALFGIFAEVMSYGGGASSSDFLIRYRESSPSSSGWVNFNISDLEGNTDSEDLIMSSASLSSSFPSKFIELQIYSQTSDPSKSITMRVYQGIILYTGKMTLSASSKLYFGGLGIEYGSWISGRSTAEGYTETHADDDSYQVIETQQTDGQSQYGSVLNKFHSALSTFNTYVTQGDILLISSGDAQLVGQYTINNVIDNNNLTITGNFSKAATGLTFTVVRSITIENPAGVIESIYRDIVGLTSAEIDVDSFNVASNDLDGLKLTVGISDTNDDKKFIGEIAEYVNSLLYFDEYNKAVIKVHNSSPNYSQNDKIDAIESTSGRNFVNLFSDTPEKAFRFSNTNYQNIRIVETGTGSSTFVVTLDNPAISNYVTGAIAALYLQMLVNSASAWDYTVAYSTTTKKFTISLDSPSGKTFKLDFNHASSDFCCEMFGFYKGSTHTGAATYTSDFPISEGQFLGSLISADSFDLHRDNAIINKLELTLNNKNIETYEDTTSQSDYGILPKREKHKFTSDVDTADVYGNNFITRNKDSIFKFEFDVVGITPVIYDQWDIICIDHPILTGIFSDVFAEKWKILALELDANDLSYHVIAERV